MVYDGIILLQIESQWYMTGSKEEFLGGNFWEVNYNLKLKLLWLKLIKLKLQMIDLVLTILK